jgi:hypothetical protein
MFIENAFVPLASRMLIAYQHYLAEMIGQFGEPSKKNLTKRCMAVLKCARNAFSSYSFEEEREVGGGHDSESAILITHHSWLRNRRERRRG